MREGRRKSRLLAYTGSERSLLVAGLFGILSVTIAALTFSNTQRLERQLFQEAEDRAEYLAASLSQRFSDALYFNDVEEIRNYAETLGPGGDLRRVAVFGRDGRYMVDSSQPKIPAGAIDRALFERVSRTVGPSFRRSGDRIEAVAPTRVQSELIGGVYVELDLATVNERVAAVRKQQILQAVVLVFLAAGLSIALLKAVRAARSLDVSEARFEELIDQSPVGTSIFRPDGTLLYANRAQVQMMGESARADFRRDYNILQDPQLIKSGLHPLLKKGFTEEATRLPTFSYQLGDPDDSESRVIWVRSVIFPLRAAGGEIHQVVVISEDVTSQKQTEERLSFLANFDSLTGLPNRSLFHDRLEHAVAVANRGGRLAILFIGLDRFKRVNDSLGHVAGDAVLKEASNRLVEAVRKKDTVARLGGDEFVVLLEDVDDQQQDAIHVAGRIIRALGRRFYLSNDEVRIGASIGISLFPEDSEDIEDLVPHADRAMHAAKQNGRNRFEFYDSRLNETALHRLKLEGQLHKAVKEGELHLYYQPLVDGRSGQILSVEALIRWQHPELNLLQPDDFIPLAEESGLINTVGNWVIREACRQLSTWAKAGYDHLVVAANISTHQLRTTDLPGFVAGALREAGVRGNRLALEITEGVVMDDPDQVLVALGALKSLGIKLAVDDFGTGYSSLAYLKRFPLDVLKVDRVFVEDIVENQNDADLVAAIVTMAKGLGLAVVAEGVETEEQFRVLRQLGCRRFQGYLFSPPVPAEELERLLEQPAPFRAVCQPRGLDSNRA